MRVEIAKAGPGLYTFASPTSGASAQASVCQVGKLRMVGLPAEFYNRTFVEGTAQFVKKNPDLGPLQARSFVPVTFTADVPKGGAQASALALFARDLTKSAPAMKVPFEARRYTEQGVFMDNSPEEKSGGLEGVPLIRYSTSGLAPKTVSKLVLESGVQTLIDLTPVR